jgi:tetratricopeptide (TPR) repeat protein
LKNVRTLFLYFVTAACASAQYGYHGCCAYTATPSQLDMWDKEVPFEKPSSPPSGESVSVVRLTHKPPAKARDAFQRGIKLDRAGAPENAATEFEKAIALDPDFSEAHGNLGVEYTAMGRLDDAIAEFHRALALDPATSFHHSNLAYALIRLNRNQEAESEAQMALGVDSGNATAQFLLGFLWARRPDKRKAAETYLTSAARTVPAAHLVLAQMYTAEGSVEIARAELDRYQEATTPGNKAHVNHGQSFLSPR